MRHQSMVHQSLLPSKKRQRVSMFSSIVIGLCRTLSRRTVVPLLLVLLPPLLPPSSARRRSAEADHLALASTYLSHLSSTERPVSIRGGYAVMRIALWRLGIEEPSMYPACSNQSIIQVPNASLDSWDHLPLLLSRSTCTLFLKSPRVFGSFHMAICWG